ncbi:hypothetical protein GGI21_004623, partial [Coemansia aciculifera]
MDGAEIASRHNLLLWISLAVPLPPSDADALRQAIDITTDELTVFIALQKTKDDSDSDKWSHMQRRITELYTVAANHSFHQQQRADTKVDIVPLDFCAYSPDDMQPFKHNATLIQGSGALGVP